MHTASLRKVGGSVMLAVPPALLDILRLQPGAKVGITVRKGGWSWIRGGSQAIPWTSCSHGAIPVPGALKNRASGSRPIRWAASSGWSGLIPPRDRRSTG